MPGSGSGGNNASYNPSGQSYQTAGKNPDFAKNANMDSGGSGGNGYKKPRNIIDAVSEIQQYYVLEKMAEDPLPKEYFTIKQTLDFFNIGARSAFLEGIIFLLIVPFAEALYPSFKLFFFGHTLSSNEQISVYASSYGSIFAMLIFIAALARYYEGNLTKNAIASLLTGRSMVFMFKGMIVFFIWAVISGILMSNPSNIYWLAEWTLNIFKFLLNGYEVNVDIVYQYLYESAIPAMDKTANHILLTMTVASFLPFMTLFMRGWTRGRLNKDAKKQYEEY